MNWIDLVSFGCISSLIVRLYIFDCMPGLFQLIWTCVWIPADVECSRIYINLLVELFIFIISSLYCIGAYMIIYCIYVLYLFAFYIQTMLFSSPDLHSQCVLFTCGARLTWASDLPTAMGSALKVRRHMGKNKALKHIETHQDTGVVLFCLQVHDLLLFVQYHYL